MGTAAKPTNSLARFAIPRRVPPSYAKELRSRVSQALDDGERRFVIDCEAWDSIDVMTLSSLVQCASACRAIGASFEVTNLSTQIRDDVRTLQLDDRLGLAD
jgi:anti-anti-sigma regulatory factor